MVLLSSVDQIVHMCKNLKSSSKVEQEETVDSGVLCEQPLRSRMCELLQRTLQSIDSAASDYYDNDVMIILHTSNPCCGCRHE